MTEAAADLVAHLRMLDVTLTVDGDQLRMNAPRGAITPGLRDELAAHKADIVGLLRAADQDGTQTAPASFAQRRMWLLDRFQGERSAYNIPGKLRLRGALDIAAFERSIDAIVRRHAVLRTTFEMRGSELVQRIHPASDTRLVHLDFADLPPAEQEERVQRLEQAELSRRFDLATGPLLRASLVTLAPNHHLLIAVCHHIVSDGWSMGVFVRELTEHYAAFARGDQPRVAPLALQYADFARWERRAHAGAALARQLDYWRGRLLPLAPAIELPSEHVRPAVATFEGARVVMTVPQHVAARVPATADRLGVTTFMLLLATFNALLYRLSGHTDVSVGTPVANRSQLNLEGLIGFFVNTLVLRTTVDGTFRFTDYLAQVRDVAFDAFANQEIPFEKVVEELNPPRDPGRNPFFQTMFVVRRAGDAELTLPGVVASILEPADSGVAKFDLTAMVVEKPGALSLDFEYSTGVFDRDSVVRLAESYVILLESVLANPELPIALLDIVAPDVQHRVLHAFNATANDHAPDLLVHTRVAGHAARAPNAIAVVMGGQTMTYGELDRRANGLASRLREIGVIADSRVGICVERSPEMIVALLAVLKAGGAYVPLDPSLPAERIRYMIDDSAAVAVIAHAHVRELVSATPVPVIVLANDGAEGIAQLDTAPDVSGLTSRNLAYVIYTSGSTGRPKGVEVEHRNLAAFLDAMHRAPGVGERDVLLAVTTLSFDIAGLEIWLPLVHGARVVIASRADTMEPARLARTIEEHHVTILQATPLTWRRLMDGGWPGNNALKALCGGEALPAALAAALLPRVSELWNMYGPTETTIWSTAARITSADDIISIGRPIANTRVYVLDRDGRPVPPWVRGELCIAGAGVARGYRNLPELTAEKFVTISLPDDITERLYRTGDSARFLGDGTLQYFNRLDTQVKIRGYRIELGEIESVIAEATGALAAVVARTDAAGEARLFGYVVSSDPAFDQNAVKARLREKLPEYMIPTAIAPIPRLPLTPNGKLDRQALPAPDAEAPRSAALPQASMTPAQQRIAAIWRDVLGTERVGLHDNFFDLGGQSLLLVRLHAALEHEFGITMPLVELFQRTTVAAQADRVHGPAPGASSALERARARAARQRD